MKIKQLLEHVEVLLRSCPCDDIEVSDIACDSRQVKKGVLFVAVKGSLGDGHRYIEGALQQNASAIILENCSFLPVLQTKIPHILVKNSKQALNQIADVFFDDPYQKIPCVGITGTNGKTTVSYLIRSILKAAGIKSGLIGTIGYCVGQINQALANTTPGVIDLHKLFKEMIEAKNKYVVMEVSSHALDQERVAGIIFKTAIFTNLTQDHLDYHKDMATYFAAKQKLFKDYVHKDTALVINQDDPFGRRLLSSLKGKIVRYGFSSEADISAVSYGLSKDGCRALIKTAQGPLEILTKLVGQHNLYNILAAVAFGVAEGLKPSLIKKGIEDIACIPGRLDRIDAKKGFTVFVDYAHTDDALKNVLESLRRIVHNGRIIAVFGCGGDRDRGKRPKMGCVGSSLSDYCIVTSDNPRSENPKTIIEQIVSGIQKKNFEIEVDRLKAIQKALHMAQKNDVVLIAGKGHETYQIIGHKTLPFDDKATVLKLLEKNV